MARIVCDCKDEYQDKKYGKGKRVANKTASGSLRCAKCGKVSGEMASKKGKK